MAAYALTKCFKCNRVITGQSREIGKRMFHFDCLTCANCKRILGGDDNGKVRESRIYCKPCFTKKFRSRCDLCKNPIEEGQGLNSAGKTIHQLCFRCAGCQRPMGPGKQVMIKGSVYCRVQCQVERVAREKAAAEALLNAAKNAMNATPVPTPPVLVPVPVPATETPPAVAEPVDTTPAAAECEEPPADAQPAPKGAAQAEEQPAPEEQPAQ